MKASKPTGANGPITASADVGEPLLWNPLPNAAEWLTRRLGRTIDARGLMDCIIKTRTSAVDSPKSTVIKALLPREHTYANIAMPGHPDIEALELGGEHVEMSKRLGKLPGRMAYLGVVFPTVSALTASELIELLLYGTKTIAIVRGGNFTNGEFEMTWVVPWGTGHEIAIESCGINRDDLRALSDALAAPPIAELGTAAPLPYEPVMPWIETPVMAQCLSGFGEWNAATWLKKLGTPPKWMQSSIMLRRGAQGRRANCWQPVLLIDAIIHKKKTTPDVARKKFKTSSHLSPWLDAWDEHAAMMYPTD